MRIRPQPRRRTRTPLWSGTQAGRAVASTESANTRKPVGDLVGERASDPVGGLGASAEHPLTPRAENERLRAYEQRVKDAFARIVPTLKSLAARQHEAEFVTWAQEESRRQLGFELPGTALEDAWVNELDMRQLFAHATFETLRIMSGDYFGQDPLATRDRSDAFQAFLLDCGFHAMNVTPCADGRLAHAISYVLRLPMGAVRRTSYAGTLFDVEEAVDRWASVELSRFREGVPNLADAATRYLKVVSYHYSSRDPTHHGCAAHGSDTRRAALAGLEQLRAFREAVENSYCCGASIEVLLIGIDTDTDRLRIHLPGANGDADLDRFIDAGELYGATARLDAGSARDLIRERIAAPRDGGRPPEPGMQRLMARLIEHNIAQIDYVRRYEGGHYADIGHEERFIGVGSDFEEIQLRNLTYFAFMRTLEEGAPNLDVGIKIFRRLNVAHGLPIPIVLRFDYSGQVPGARERAIQRCARIAEAIAQRYPDLTERGLIQTFWTVRDSSRAAPAEPVGGSLAAMEKVA
jgi:carboxysome shell carbonic anhydrase